MTNTTTKKQNIKLFCLILFSSIAIMPFAVNADDWVDLFKSKYDFDQWAGTTKTNYLNSVLNFQPNLTEIGFSHFRFNDNDVVANGIDRRYIVSTSPQTDEVLDIRISSRNNVINAQNSMMDFFSTCSAKQPFPSGDLLSVPIGDKCYLGYPTNTVSSIMFVRNTVFIDVTLRGTTNSVLPIAVWLDNSIFKLSLKE